MTVYLHWIGAVDYVVELSLGYFDGRMGVVDVDFPEVLTRHTRRVDESAEDEIRSNALVATNIEVYLNSLGTASAAFFEGLWDIEFGEPREFGFKPRAYESCGGFSAVDTLSRECIEDIESA